MEVETSSREELDALLTEKAEHWVNVMPATDRNLLRLGAYEIRYSDTPDRVAINEPSNSPSTTARPTLRNSPTASSTRCCRAGNLLGRLPAAHTSVGT